MKKADLKQLSTADLREKAKDEQEALKKMQFTHSISPVESPARISHSRKNVARLLTELRQREISENKK